MGLLKHGTLIVLFSVGITFLPSFFEKKLPPVSGGKVHPAFQKVADVFKQNVESGKEQGAAFAVYYKGEFLVDLWGGYADPESERPWREDTISPMFSSTKGVAAIVVAYLVDKGLLDYKMPISDYWPEFAQNDKGNITVEMFLSHQGCLSVLDESIEAQTVWTNRKKVEDILSKQRTGCPAGTLVLYHAVTYGLYVDTLVTKVDPKGRHTGQIFREDIASKFGLDVYLNTPLEEFYRLSRLQFKPLWKQVLKALMSDKHRKLHLDVMLNPNSPIVRAATAVKDYMPIERFNDPYIREAVITSASGSATARGLAKLYGIIGNGGSDMGKQLLTPAIVEKLKLPIPLVGEEFDPNFGAFGQGSRKLTFGPGTSTLPNIKGKPIVGHTGYGGQLGVWDPKTGFGFAYLTNFMDIYDDADDPRLLDLQEALYDCFENYVAKQA